MKMRKFRIKQQEATTHNWLELTTRYYMSNGGHRKTWPWRHIELQQKRK